MQQSKDPRAAETYLTWQDLLDEDDKAPAEEPVFAPAVGEGPPVPHGHPPGPSAAPPALPPDVQALMVEKERLEGELARLTGQGPPRPEEERMRRMYPVRVHTKESRIEDRRLRRHDEQQRMLKQRVLEKKLVQARERDQQEIAAAQRKRRALEVLLAKARADVRAAEAEQRQRRRAAEAAAAAARAARRREERAVEQERQEIEQALVQARWTSDREKALRRRARARHHERTQQVDELDRRRRVPPPASADERAVRRATSQGSVPDRQQASMRTDGARNEPQQARYAEARRAAQAWEEERERLREQALARLRAARAEAAGFDRRGKKRDRFEDVD